jgi:hypothetical protein
VQVHLDTDGAWLTGRPRLPQHVTDKLTCDGTLTPVWETAGQPVNLGRSYRVVPDRLRDLVLDRDRGCRFPACASRHHLEIHHLLHWRDGGRTDLDNLLALCPFHHDGHHRGEFTITGDPTLRDGLTFETEHGLLIGPPARSRPAALAVVPDDPSTGHRPGRAPAREPESDVATGPGATRATEPSTRPSKGPSTRPAARLGRSYPAPSGETLHLHLVDLTPRAAAGTEHDRLGERGRGPAVYQRREAPSPLP